MIKLLALDLDGTLAIDNHQVMPATRDALQALHKDDVHVVIATGRRYRTTRYVIENLDMEVDAICNGGALVKNSDQSTYAAESFDISPLVPSARQLGLTLFAQRDVHELGGVDFIIDNGTDWNDLIKQHHTRNADHCTDADLTSSSESYLVSGTFGPRAELTNFAERIQLLHPGIFNTVIVPHQDTGAYYCEVAPVHVDKWYGLSKLCKKYNILGSEVCAVGDQLNDLPMVTQAGHGFAMGDGSEELKTAADQICGNNDADGIVDVVDYIRTVNS